ncbi:MAG: hypothetical protein IKI28_06775 [Bacteroidales bacterium]|nr:hypothetical protein [Bacteroidales bacterium]
MKRVMIFAMALAALASCSKEQSELNFSGIEGKATITGQVTYNDGHRKDGDGFVSSTKPAANIPVIAKVDYDQYSGAAVGTKIIEATTDAEGKYTLTIPCGQKAVNVKVQPRGFTAPYYILSGSNTSETKAFFEDAEKTVSVVMGDTKVQNFFDVTRKSEEPVISRNIDIFIKGDLIFKRPADHKDYNPLETDTHTQAADAGVKMILTLTNTDNGEELVYNLATGSNGAISLNAKLFDSWKLTDVEGKLEVLPYVTSYTNKDPKTVNGYYEIAAPIKITLTPAAAIQGVGQNIGKLNMAFKEI